MPEAEKVWLERFLEHLQHERHLSAHSVAGYRRDLQGLLAFCAHESVAGWGQLSDDHLRAYVAARHRAGLSARSLQRTLSAIRSFYRYLLREDHVTQNPAQDLRAPRDHRRLPTTLDADQMAGLLGLDSEDPLAIRDRAMFELLYSSGLRLAELVSLNLDQVDLRDGTVRITGKGGKTRLVPVGRYARAAIETWLPLRAQQASVDESALFLSRRGRRISPRNVQMRLRQWAERQGFPGHVHPHMLRHSCASHLLESSGDLRAVQEMLGHADLSTTQIYTHLDFQHLARVYDQTHPRAKKQS